ncbi:MFS transporter [Motiliproteus sp. SC1-56]|uniref:MFS transporter n=1 Tax=Motiliproteus sp. SC1-56 TaxID=2799565 RepID=UPI001A9042D1|nr:MFS transporter [Motiliproteus sp. SC1-56]
MDPNRSASVSPWQLLTSVRFAPFFSTQFLGALNDNLFKNTLILLLVFESAQQGGEIDKLTNLAAALFILPYLLFSALAGQLADRHEKSALVRLLKIGELGLMLLASVALLSHNLSMLYLLLFLMATQSAFFSPIKYSLIPQHLEPSQWVAGNGLVEAGTFIAILLGTLIAGVLFRYPQGELMIAALLCLQAFLGWWACRRIPLAPSAIAEQQPLRNPARLTVRLLAQSWKQPRIRFLILAISWFWFLGAAYLTQVPHYAQAVLGGDTLTVSALLCCFTVGIGAGSLACNRLTRDRLGRDMVLIGLAGLILAGSDLFFASPQSPLPADSGLGALLAANLRVALDIVLIGAFGGCYIVPLYTQLQARTDIGNRAQTIAANNIVNALYMVLSAAMGFVLLGLWHWPLETFFLTLALLNLPMAAYVVWSRPGWLGASFQRLRPKRQL